MDEINIPVGAVCDPRLKSQRRLGSEREAGWERRRGMLKAERLAIPPAVKRAVDMLMIWTIWAVDMMGGGRYDDFLGYVGFFRGSEDITD